MTRKNILLALCAAASLALVSGCASTPPPETMQQKVEGYQLPKLPEEGKAVVYVVRPALAGKIVSFNVFVDDKEEGSEMGFTKGRQYIYFNLLPGTHKIYSKAENWAEIEVTAKAGEILFIQQEPSFGVVMARNSLQRIEEEYQGKYHVKTLRLGTILKANK